MKIYLASSWRNATRVREVIIALRAAGHDVYDFTDPVGDGSDLGFAWQSIDPTWQQWSFTQYKRALQHPRAEEGFSFDYNAMQASDACVLLLPCGRSAHLEAGWFVGQGRPLLILIDRYDEPDLMYKMATGIHESLEDVLAALAGFKNAFETGPTVGHEISLGPSQPCNLGTRPTIAILSCDNPHGGPQWSVRGEGMMVKEGTVEQCRVWLVNEGYVLATSDVQARYNPDSEVYTLRHPPESGLVSTGAFATRWPSVNPPAANLPSSPFNSGAELARLAEIARKDTTSPAHPLLVGQPLYLTHVDARGQRWQVVAGLHVFFEGTLRDCETWLHTHGYAMKPGGGGTSAVLYEVQRPALPAGSPSVYNYRTKRFDTVPPLVTEEECRCYIPQDAPTQLLFSLKLAGGLTPHDALIDVLRLCVAPKEKAE